MLIRLANRIKASGHEVKILTTNTGFDSSIIKSIRLPRTLQLLNRLINRVLPNYFSFIYSSMLKEISELNPDIINFHWTHGNTIPLKLIRKCNETWSVFWTLHDQWPITINTYFQYEKAKVIIEEERTLRQRLGKMIEMRPGFLYNYKTRMLADQDIHTISPSKWLYNQVLESPVFSAAINHCIPNGVDTDIFKPLNRNSLKTKYGIDEDKKVVLFLSANITDERKGFYYFVKALELLAETDPGGSNKVTTVLVGNNNAGLSQYIPGEVVNLGSTYDPSKLAEYYNLADVFVSASIADNFPSTALESIACGTPVVAFDVGGISEIAVHGKTGFLAENRNVSELADSILSVISIHGLWSQLSSNCRKYAVGNFTMDKFSDSYIDLFNTVSVKAMM